MIMAASSRPPIFFFLAPRNLLADQIVANTANASFRYDVAHGVGYLRIGIDHDPKVPGQLISFGHDPFVSDIILPRGFPGRQCCFMVNAGTGEMLLRDDTEDHSTYIDVPGGPDFDLPDSGLRQRVLSTSCRTPSVQMGDALFKLLWGDTKRAFNAASTKPILMQSFPLRNSRGFGEIVHSRIRELGRGATSTVWLTLDLTTGNHLAVKLMLPNPGEDVSIQQQKKRQVGIEAGLLSHLSHVRPDLTVIPLSFVADFFVIISQT